MLHRNARPAFRAALLAVALAAARARGLDVGSLAAKIHAPHGDMMRLAGRAHGLSIADGDTLVLTVDVLTFDVPVPARARSQKTIAFHGPKAEPGLRAFSYHRRSGRFRAVLVGVPLSGMPNPFALRLAAGTTQDCALVRVATSARGRHGNHGDTMVLQLAGSQLAGTCSAIDVVGLDPATVMVGTPTAVAVTAQPPAGLGADGVALYRADETGAPAGNALCMLQDDGSDAHGDAAAGDGIFGCLATFTESTAGIVPLVVQATVGGTTIGSTGFDLRVASPLTADDAASILATQAQAESIWEQNVGRDGYTTRTQTETIVAVRTLDGVADVGVGGDGLTIDITYPSGVVGSILWAPRFADEDAVPAALDRRAATPVHVTAPAVARAPETAPVRTLIGNRRALVWDAGFFGASEADAGSQILAASLCPYFDPPDITFIKGDAATVDSLAGLTQYDTVVLVTHGIVNKKFKSTTFVTKEVATAESALLHAADLQALRVSIVTAFGTPYFGIGPSYLRSLPGRFDHAVVYGGFCSSAQNPSLFASFVAKGAAAYFGYTAPVGNTFAKSTGAAIVTGLVKARQTTLMAYAGLPITVDPYTSKADLLSKRAARITLTLAPGIQDLAYLDLPTLMPDAPFLSPSQSVALTTDMKGSENCDLTYLWHTPAAQGHLHDGIAGHEDNFSSTMKTATYTANADASGTDTVRVSIAPAEQPDDGIGEATATITFGCELCSRAIAGAACSCSAVTLTPATTNLVNAHVVTLTPSVSGTIGAGHVIFYRWHNTALYGHVADGVPGDVDDFTTSIAVNASYKANDEGLGTDTITVEAYDGDPAQGGLLLGMASATVSVVLGGGTQFVLNPASLCVPGQIQAGTSCGGWVYNVIFVCSVAGQQAKNGIFYAHPGDSVHLEGYTCGQRCADYSFSLPSYPLFPPQQVCLPSDPPPGVVVKVVDDTALIPYSQFGTGQACCQLAATCFEFVVGSAQESSCAQMGGTAAMTFCGGNGTCGQP